MDINVRKGDKEEKSRKKIEGKKEMINKKKLEKSGRK